MNNKHNFLFIDGVFYDRYGKRLHGCAEQACRATYLNDGLKQTLDQNERLKEALFYSLSILSTMGIRFQ
ncbi:hypothetical protein [Helicobacter pylori]|uniref:hypothetical protein n=1 Tax=Helicobacter pylori TaxID=210 RepID=UPI000EAC95AE|nr:hypothetical protein [Helicobacter pylori]